MGLAREKYSRLAEFYSLQKWLLEATGLAEGRGRVNPRQGLRPLTGLDNQKLYSINKSSPPDDRIDPPEAYICIVNKTTGAAHFGFLFL